ncbi:MAG: MerR family transcriptional regulator [Agathobacter sp.]|nr:MerR family transcriptional regulator [Agathobacter sp.]
MTIKDVEKRTGLTAKSIRYYEGKGLLTVGRNEENDYRSYSEAEVNRLKKIKLLRYLEFSVEDVKAMLDMDVKDIEKILRQKADDFEDLRDRCKDKQELCLSLAKDYKKSDEVLNQVVSEYNEFIEQIESDEIAEAVESLKDLGTPSFSMVLLQTLMFSGPVWWLFLNISDGNFEDLMLNAVLAVLGTVLITAAWIFYFVQRSKHKERVKKRNRAQIWLFPILILGLVLGFALIMGINSLVQRLFIPEDYMFYSYPRFAMYGMIFMIMTIVVGGGFLLVGKTWNKDNPREDVENGWLWIWNRLGKWKWAVIVAMMLAMYCCVTSLTVVTEDAIICHSPIQPMGVEYSYSDVEQITTGIGQKKFTFQEHKRKGEFYYQIKLDGKTITFMTDASSNGEIERYDEHTYLWYEEFDQKLVDLGIPKQGDITGYENLSLDQEYIDRFIRIIENQ